MPRILAALLLLPALAAGCGGHGHAAGSTTRKAPVLLNAGRLVEIGGGRSLYLHCVGSGSPTVVLEAGFGGSSDVWSGVQPQLGRTTRTCAYDRAGLGNSLPMHGVHDAGDEIRDLEALLQHAKVPPPYVLVGHSYGGLLVRLFAASHARQTDGVVLVDAMGRDQDRRSLAVRRTLPATARRKLPVESEVQGGVDLAAGEALDAKLPGLGALPLAVITRGRNGSEDTGLPAQARRALDGLWTKMQAELAALSTDRVHVVATRSDHFVQSAAAGQPGVVIRAVRAVAAAARTRTSLPPCPRVFDGPGVRCLD